MTTQTTKRAKKNKWDIGRKLDKQEKLCGNIAFETVRDAGGFVSFDKYDELISQKFLPAPIGWCAGWGNGMMQYNQQVQAAWTACIMGLMDTENGGYKCLKQ